MGGVASGRPQRTGTTMPPGTKNTRRDTNIQFTNYGIGVGDEGEQISGDNLARVFIKIMNVGGATAHIGFGRQANISDGVPLAPNSYLSFEGGVCPTNDIYAVSSIGTRVIILEGVKK